MNSSYKDHYQVLGITPQTTHAQIKEAFHKLSMIHHPDRNRNSEKSNRIYRIILNAYKILSNKAKRTEYDEFLKKSEYIKKFGRNNKTYINGKVNCDNNEILEKINITLWELDEIIINNRINAYSRKYILIILTFLDKWILEEYGFPDYFMESRKLIKKDPREYIKMLNKRKDNKEYLPYFDIKDYYYDIKKRADKFITKYEKKIIWEENIDHGIGLFDRIIEYNNMAIHYLSYLLDNEKELKIPLYEFSDSIYNYDY